MRTTTLTLAAIAAFSFSAMQATAASFMLDDFTTSQVISADPPLSTNVLGGAGTGIAAESRDLFADNTLASVNQNSTGVTSIESGGGFLTFNNETGARGIGTITYNNFDLFYNVDEGFFVFDVVAGGFDGNAVFSVDGKDDNDKMISYSESLTGGFSPILRFSVLTGSASFDFRNVAYLTFSIDSTTTAGSIDGALRGIEVSAVPLPASSLLLLGGLGGLMAMRRRKTKATV
jgi:hypothetical protein